MVGQGRWGHGDRDHELPDLAVGPEGREMQESTVGCSTCPSAGFWKETPGQGDLVSREKQRRGKAPRPRQSGDCRVLRGQFPPQYSGAPESTVKFMNHWLGIATRRKLRPMALNHCH